METRKEIVANFQLPLSQRLEVLENNPNNCKPYFEKRICYHGAKPEKQWIDDHDEKYEALKKGKFAMSMGINTLGCLPHQKIAGNKKPPATKVCPYPTTWPPTKIFYGKINGATKNRPLDPELKKTRP